MNLKFIRFPSGEGLDLPAYATPGAAGLDLRAAIPGPLMLPSRTRMLLPTGFGLELPPDIEAQIRPRSGLAARHGVTVLNAPGTIDSDFRGEIGVILYNASLYDFKIMPGDRIAQMVLARFIRVTHFEVTQETSQTERGERGFGSTGTI